MHSAIFITKGSEARGYEREDQMNSRTIGNIKTPKRILILLSTLITFLLLLPNHFSFAATMVAVDGHGKENNIISAYELHKILTDHFGFVSIKLSDAQYALPDTGMFEQLKNSKSTRPQNGDGTIQDWGDDDYAFAAMVPMRNYAFGTIFFETPQDGKRIMNVFVDSNKKIVYWDAKACKYCEARLDKAEFILF